MALPNHFASIVTSTDSRGRLRRKLLLEVDASTPAGEAYRTVVRNLSETGLLIETTAALALGDLIEVDLPRAGAAAATVMWNSDRLFGCNFAEDLSAGTVSAALLRAASQPHAAGPGTVIGPAPEAALPTEKLSLPTRAWTITGLALLSWAAVAALIAWMVA
jgi:hypothetical protein